MYGFVEFVIKVRWRSAWHGYQWCVRKPLFPNCPTLQCGEGWGNVRDLTFVKNFLIFFLVGGRGGICT